MLPYLTMFAVPGSIAMWGTRRSVVLLAVVAVLYWLMIGLRFQVGMDWDNYVYIYLASRDLSFGDALFSLEPGFKLLMWLGARIGGGVIFVNAIAALVFCWGFFAFARRCPEPFLAIVVATPMLVVAFAMSGTRQAMALGIISHLFATWEKGGAVRRMWIVVIASLFHFSAIFVMMFVALSARIPAAARIAAAGAVAAVIVAVMFFWPAAMEAYSRLYVSGGQQLRAPGAIAQTGVIALAAIAYFAGRNAWNRAYGDEPLYSNLAIAAILAVPAILISSVGAYRFALYLWPLAMYVASGVPRAIQSGVGRLLYRLSITAASAAILVGWLTLANNSFAWLPYKNWLFQPEGAAMMSRHGS